MVSSRVARVNGHTYEPRPIAAITSAQLDNDTADVEYLIPGLLVRGQPGGIFGSKKSLKTTIAIDLALSLAGGVPFLGRFKPARQVRVGIFSGESGRSVIAETARRIARARGTSLANFGGIRWAFDLPKLSRPEDLSVLHDFIEAERLEVVIVDPTYMSLSLGDGASNLFEVGSQLAGVTRLGQLTGATILLLHHTRKASTNPFAPPELEDIAWAGFQEWVRQWLLIGRREPYDPANAGQHRLWMTAGGSAGHCGLWGLNVQEGSTRDRGGRRWEVDVLTAAKVRELLDAERKERKELREVERASAQTAKDRQRVIDALQQLPDGGTAKRIRTAAGMSGSRIAPILESLVSEGVVSTCTVKVGNKSFDGFKMTRGTCGTSGTGEGCPGDGERDWTPPPSLEGGSPCPGPPSTGSGTGTPIGSESRCSE